MAAATLFLLQLLCIPLAKPSKAEQSRAKPSKAEQSIHIGFPIDTMCVINGGCHGQKRNVLLLFQYQWKVLPPQQKQTYIFGSSLLPRREINLSHSFLAS